MKTRRSSVTDIPRKYLCQLSALLLFGLTAVVPAQNPAPAAKNLTVKECGSAIATIKARPGENQASRSIAPGQVHCYRVALMKGQFVRFEIMQRGVDLVVQLLDSLGKPVSAPIDSPNFRDGAEPISEVVTKDSEYIIAVKSQDKPSDRDPIYNLEIKVVRSAVPADSTYVMAERAFLQGQLQLSPGPQRNIAEAVKNLEEAHRLLEPSQVKPALWGEVLNRLGFAYAGLRRNDEAHKLFTDLLEFSGVTKSVDMRTVALISLAKIHAAKGEVNSAETRFKEAVEVQGEVSAEVKGQAWLDRGNWYSQRRDVLAALDAAERAASFYYSAKNFNKAANIYSSIGVAHFNRGSLIMAREYYLKALKAGPTDPQELGFASYNLGVTLAAMGRYQPALDALFDAKKFYEEAKKSGLTDQDAPDEALSHVLKTLGLVHSEVGNERSADEFYRQALSLSEKDGTPIYLDAAAYIHLYRGLSAYRSGSMKLATDETERALKLFEKLEDNRGKANALANVGFAYYQAGNYDTALKLLEQAKGLQASDPRGRAYSMTNIARIKIDMNKTSEALKILEDALKLRGGEAEDKSGEAITRYTMALAELRGSNLSAAFKHIDAAINLVEDIRRNLASTGLRESYRGTVDKIYKLYIDILMRQGRIAEALELEDNSRARGLVETLVNAQINLPTRLDPTDIQRKGTLEEEILSLAGKRQLLGREMQDSKAAVDLNRQIDQKVVQLRVIEEEELRDSRRAALVAPSRLSIEEMSSLLEPNTVLLVYSLGEERSYVWLVTNQGRNGLKSFILPNGKQIDDLGKRARNLLINPNLDASGLLEYQRLSRELSTTLLGQLEADLHGKHLVIVADGILQYFPFSALPEPNIADWQPLIIEHEIVNIPSAAALSAISVMVRNRPVAPETIALTADPVYVLSRGVAQAKSKAATSSEKTLKPLAFAKREITAIKDAYAKLENPQ